MATDLGRVASPNRLSSTTEPASSLDPTGFDPARIPQLVSHMRSVADCDARAGEPLGKALRSGADAIMHLYNALDWIANETDTSCDFDGPLLRDRARDAIWPGHATATQSTGETA